MLLLQATKPRTETSQFYYNSLITEADIRCFSVFLKLSKRVIKNLSGNFRFDFRQRNYCTKNLIMHKPIRSNIIETVY